MPEQLSTLNRRSRERGKMGEKGKGPHQNVRRSQGPALAAPPKEREERAVNAWRGPDQRLKKIFPLASLTLA
jgi:hypothetical protein